MLDDALLSRAHARLTVSDGEAVLVDLDSKNGTYVNEVRLLGPARLHNGDQLRLGHTRMELAVVRSKASRSRSHIRTKAFATQVDLPHPAGEPHPGGEPHPAGEPADVLFRMLKMGRLDEAGKLLKSRVANLTANDDPLPVSHIMSRNVQEGLLTMAERSLDGIWLHRLFALHVRCDWFMTTDVQQKAQQLIRAVGKLGGDGLRAYVSHWDARSAKLSASQNRELDRLRELAGRDT